MLQTYFEATRELDGNSARDYASLVSNSQDSTFYHSLKYVRLLNSFLDATPVLTLAYKDGQVIGAIPVFIKRNRKFGTVMNSLPFYGSYGGVLVKSGLDKVEAIEVFDSVIEYLVHELCREEDVSLSTVISWPYTMWLARYKRILSPQYQEHRIAQMVMLQSGATEDQLLSTFQSGCRRSIKKAANSQLSVRIVESFEKGTIDELYEIHVENMQKINAPSKPRVFFHNISKFFDIHKDYDVYIAECRNELVGALLVFYSGNVVEYFLPAVKAEYRSLNPTHLILLKAMSRAAQLGMRIWNFGGTRKEMRGIHMFKESFGAKDYSYYSHTSVLSDVSCFLELTPSNMRTQYEWFYVLPYEALGKQT